MTLRVLFADDEAMARKRMRRLLEAQPNIEIVAECTSGEEALLCLDAHAVDVALLDVHMGLVSGLQVSELAADLGVEVILTTAHAEHAVEAFEKGAIDYLLKPIDEARLAQALSRASARIQVAPTPSAQPTDRLAIESHGEVHLLNPEDVSHATSDGQLVTLVTTDRELLTERTLAELERRLPSLLRVHRRALLSLAHVDRLKPQPTGGYVAIMKSGHEVPVSRQEARELRRRLQL
jgi:two-component system LytT family response regulator